MTLKDYLDKRNITQKEFADRLECHYMTVYKMRAGKRGMSPEMAVKVEIETGYLVSRLEGLYPDMVLKEYIKRLLQMRPELLEEG